MYPPERQGRGISLVLFGAVFGALLGPLVFAPIFAAEGPEGRHLITSWIAAASFMVVGLVLVLAVRPDPQRIGALLAGQTGQGNAGTPQVGAALIQILRRPGIVPGILAAAASFSVMAGTMSLTGHVLVGHGHHQGAVFPVISAHFVGMFGLSPVTGSVIDRVGRTRALVGGLLLLGSSVLSLAWTVESIAATSVALFGIGLGWNFSYVAATAELSGRTVPAERGKILGFADLLSGLLGAGLASLGGLVLATTGLVGLSIAGLALVVAPAYWILRTTQEQRGQLLP
jgi:MFS family permease